MINDKDIEIITIREALTRIHLEGLIPEGACADMLVGWRGYPKPFACGNDNKRGFGPIVEGKPNDRYGSGREIQEKCRISQCYCSGAVLFSWQCISACRDYYLRTSACIVIDNPPDCMIDTVLKLVWSD